jgi:hypothetical protein
MVCPLLVRRRYCALSTNTRANSGGQGTEGFLFSLISRLEQDFGLTAGSLAAVRLDPTLRAKAGELLVPPKDNKVCNKVSSHAYFCLVSLSCAYFLILLAEYFIRPPSLTLPISQSYNAYSTETSIHPSLRFAHPPQYIVI